MRGNVYVPEPGPKTELWDYKIVGNTLMFMLVVVDSCVGETLSS